MKIRFSVISLIFSTLILFNCSKKESDEEPIRLYFTPSVDADVIAESSKNLISFLEKETGYKYKTAIPASYVAVVEAFGANKADVAIINSFSYLLANEKYGTTAKLRVIRNGSQFYSGQIITHVESGIDSLSQLNGKKFAFTDAASTSGYILPSKLLLDKGVKLSNTVFAEKHDNVVTMVYQRQVDAGATYYNRPLTDGTIQDARLRVKTQFPDVEQKIKIIALTDSIPNDPIIFNSKLDTVKANKICLALVAYMNTPEGKEYMKKMYSFEGLVFAKDSDYDSLREIIKKTNLALDGLVK
ncbi:MAG: phosphate/phosphite/phosphonate ABC transporter substrate-binding protein [Bacteroidota bacterium]|nr:phosphate/phosphite/phosphonate ABC transporter substrate-binding protein [Bacteroidota bacterium]